MSRVLLHVGAPKTGTSFVQDLLFRNRESLAQQGILYPADRFDAHFLAALDLMELPWGGLETEAVGSWDRLAEQVRSWDGPTIVSHEILARATKTQARRAFESFGDAEVHVILSARDLVRQLPAEWQENVKHRRTIDYTSFLADITDPDRSSEIASWFWGVQEIPDILDRWGSTLPPERVHLVTVPPRGAPQGLLWERFAHLFGLDPAAFDTKSERANPSLGTPETDFIRRINERVNGVIANEHYREFVRELLAHRTLSLRVDSPRLAVPPAVEAWATDLSQAWVKILQAKGYDVVGTLEELIPVPGATFVDPDVAPHGDEVALAATVTLLGEAARLRQEHDKLRHELEVAKVERDEAVAINGPIKRFKRRVVRAGESNSTAGVALRIYRKLLRRGGPS